MQPFHTLVIYLPLSVLRTSWFDNRERDNNLEIYSGMGRRRLTLDD